MNVPVIAFFNSKGGVGTTCLVYHLAWMFNDLRVKVLAVDLDPQADLTAALLGADSDELLDRTLYAWFREPSNPRSVVVDERVYLLPADLNLSNLEEKFAIERPGQTMDLWRTIHEQASLTNSQLVLLDLGPNLSAINRAGLLCADHIVVPVTTDYSSLEGLRNLGPALARWQEADIGLSAGLMRPLGYIVLLRPVRFDRPANGNSNWIGRIPDEYRRYVLSESTGSEVSIQADPFNLGVLKAYPGLMSMAQEAGKPMFHLKPADGALGAYLQSAEEARKAFEALARTIAAKTKLPIALTA